MTDKMSAEEWFAGLEELMSVAPNVNEMPPSRDREVYRHMLMTLLTMMVTYATPEALAEIEASFPTMVAEVRRMKATPQ